MRAALARKEEDTSVVLGERIRRMREEAGMTLDQLSLATGVSRAMLSKVERGERSPTVNIISRVARGFNMSLSLLLADPPESKTMSVIRRRERVVYKDPKTAFERHSLSPSDVQNGVEVLLHVLPPHKSSGRLLPYADKASKYLMVHEGTLTVTLGKSSVELAKGDSMYFEVTAPYSFSNMHKVRCSYYVVICFGR